MRERWRELVDYTDKDMRLGIKTRQTDVILWANSVVEAAEDVEGIAKVLFENTWDIKWEDATTYSTEMHQGKHPWINECREDARAVSAHLLKGAALAGKGKG